MGFGFRKRVKILPGLHLNIGKKGVSVSAKVGGVSVTRGHGRTTSTVGLPGTGMNYRKVVADGQLSDVEQPDHSELAELPYTPGLVQKFAGAVLRVLACLFVLSAVISGVAVATGEHGTIGGGLIAAGVTLLIAWGLWRWGSRALGR